jgi:Secretion system C-terminal sorting domain
MHLQKLLPIILFTILIICKAQGQAIPNASFEHWTTTNGIPALNQWTITAGQPSDTISPSPSTISYDSVYALQLKTKYVNGAGVSPSLASIRFPVNQNPKYLVGYLKAKRTGIGTAVIKVNIYSGNIKIGSGILKPADTAGNYQPFELAINYTQTAIADEAEIVFLSDDIINYAMNNTLWADKISFSEWPLGVGSNVAQNEAITIFPNPVTSILNIDFNSSINCKLELYLYDALGKVLSTKSVFATIGNNIYSIDMEKLATGNYALQVVIAKNTKTFKIVKH